MRNMIGNHKYLISTLVAVLFVCGAHSTSYGQILGVSSVQPLAEATLNESVVTLALSGATYELDRVAIGNALQVSGMPQVRIGTSGDAWIGVSRKSNTVITVVLGFTGNIDTDATLTFTVGAGALQNYDGPALTAQAPVSAQHYIQGPWLWMITNGADIARDYLDLESRGVITEAQVAQNGVNIGDTVGTFRWTHANITRSRDACKKFCARGLFGGCRTLCWLNNINKTLNGLGLGTGGNAEGYSAYALINIVSPRDQNQASLFVESGDAFKVWLNGQVVSHRTATRLGCRTVPVNLAVDPEVCTPDPVSKWNVIPILLKAGDNLLLMKVSQSGEYWGMEAQLDADFTTAIPSVEQMSLRSKADVNGDGIVNIQDLVQVASHLGQTNQSSIDVNGDGIVNIQDLVLVAGAFETTAAAPSLNAQALSTLTVADVKVWLSQAQHFALTDATSYKGILFLEQLLTALIPKETVLLPNYPNPFNPETWIPYQLPKSTDVTLTLYAVDGQMVRRLALGHQPAGIYHSRSRAAYWDGKNTFGEPVASGVYFYTLTTDDFTETRKMLIRK